MKTIHHVVDLETSESTVWGALTTTEGLVGWWSDRVNVGGTDMGSAITFTFAGDFNPIMRIDEISPVHLLTWRCIGGHDNWADNTFIFELSSIDDGRVRLRFTQDYATELSDDDYGIYNFNWGYYLESLRLLCTTGSGKPFHVP